MTAPLWAALTPTAPTRRDSSIAGSRWGLNSIRWLAAALKVAPRPMRSGSPRAMPSVIRDTASVIVGDSSRSRASRLARLNSRVSTLPPKSSISARIGGGGPMVRATRPRRWSNMAMPGNITPSLGSMDRAISAICAGGKGRCIAADTAAMAAATSAVLLAIPLPRGRGESRRKRPVIPDPPKQSSAACAACAALGASGGPAIPPSPGRIATVARLYRSMGQVTIQRMPSSIP